MNLTRRSFLGFGTALAAGASVSFSLVFARSAAGAGFGALVPDPEGVLDLPAGFRYQLLQSTGDLMSDGMPMRGAPDGMAAFPGANASQVILMRNHELSVDGGVSRLVIDTSDPQALVVVSSNDVLGETMRNCAGGPSPWGWLTCEEVSASGGVWLCPTSAESRLSGKDRVRIDAYGSFKHEAVAVDPDTFIAYLTEDDGNSCLYRFVPSDAAKDPFKGQLQAMKRVGVEGFSTALMQPGESIEVAWVNVSAETPRADAQSAAATIVVRGEGIWWFDGVVYFTATSNGQVFELTPNADHSGGTLRLLANALAGPDNVTVSPWGHLFVAEDNGSQNHLRVVDRDGAVSVFAKNRAAPHVEFAGVCFSPDGSILFVNLQGLGMTLAISGPFSAGPSPAGGAGGAGGGGGEPPRAGSGGDGGEPGQASAGEGGAFDEAGGAPAGGHGARPDQDEELFVGGGCACQTPAGSARPSAELVALGGAAALAVLRGRHPRGA